jgi:hypothetical protein
MGNKVTKLFDNQKDAMDFAFSLNSECGVMRVNKETTSYVVTYSPKPIQVSGTARVRDVSTSTNGEANFMLDMVKGIPYETMHKLFTKKVKITIEELGE